MLPALLGIIEYGHEAKPSIFHLFICHIARYYRLFTQHQRRAPGLLKTIVAKRVRSILGLQIVFLAAPSNDDGDGYGYCRAHQEL